MNDSTNLREIRKLKLKYYQAYFRESACESLRLQLSFIVMINLNV